VSKVQFLYPSDVSDATGSSQRFWRVLPLSDNPGEAAGSSAVCAVRIINPSHCSEYFN
jgi:hypothetical protein